MKSTAIKFKSAATKKMVAKTPPIQYMGMFYWK